MTKRWHCGLTLIEMLVAMVISLFALVSVSEIYLTTKQTRRVQTMQTPLTDEGRFAISMFQRLIAQAGFRPSPLTPLDPSRLSVAANVMTLRFTSDGANQMVCDGTIPAAGAAQSLVIQRVGNALECATNGSAVPDQWVAPAAVGSGNGAEVIDFHVSVGIDTAPLTPENFGCGIAAAGDKPRDCIADSYVSVLPPGVVTEQIVSARICLLLRSEATDASVQKPADVNDCSGAAIASSQNDNRLYRVFRTTVLLQNR